MVNIGKHLFTYLSKYYVYIYMNILYVCKEYGSRDCIYIHACNGYILNIRYPAGYSK